MCDLIKFKSILFYLLLTFGIASPTHGATRTCQFLLSKKYINLPMNKIRIFLKEARAELTRSRKNNDLSEIPEEKVSSFPTEEMNNWLIDYYQMTGRQDVLGVLIEKNIGLVYKIVRKFSYRIESSHIEFDDALSVGRIGLMTAIKKFDTDKNLKLGTYSSWWIRMEVLNLINDNSEIIKTPRNLIADVYLFKHTVNRLKKELHRMPSNDELRQELIETSHNNFIAKAIEEYEAQGQPIPSKIDIIAQLESQESWWKWFSVEDRQKIKSQKKLSSDHLDRIQWIANQNYSAESGDQPLRVKNEDSSDTIFDRMSDSKTTVQELIDFETLNMPVENYPYLNKTQIKILKLIAFQDRSQTDIAKELGLSTKTVRDQYQSALKSLRSYEIDGRSSIGVIPVTDPLAPSNVTVSVPPIKALPEPQADATSEFTKAPRQEPMPQTVTNVIKSEFKPMLNVNSPGPSQSQKGNNPIKNLARPSSQDTTRAPRQTEFQPKASQDLTRPSLAEYAKGKKKKRKH